MNMHANEIQNVDKHEIRNINIGCKPYFFGSNLVALFLKSSAAAKAAFQFCIQGGRKMTDRVR